MRQVTVRHRPLAKALATMLVAGASIVAVASTTSATAQPAGGPQDGGCATYIANDRYPLRRCDKGFAVRVLQTALHVVAPDLAVDGYFGARTERALLDYERIWGLPAVDGIVDAHTWSSLTWRVARGTDADGTGVIDPWELSGAAPAPPSPPGSPVCSSYRADYAYPIQLCGRGEGVRVAQVHLAQQVDPDLVADGYFGPVTQAAVRDFQSLRDLAVTGEIDLMTWWALTGGSADGDDGDGSGVVDPWEIGLSASGFPPAAGPLTGGPTIWAVVLGVSTWEQDPGLWPLFDAAESAGYHGTAANYCPDGDGGASAGAAVNQPPGSYFIVAVPFRGEEVARRAQRAFADVGMPTGVALLRSSCFR